MDVLREALEIENEMIAHRQHFHQYPEIGIHLPKTTEKVKAALSSYDIEYKEIIPCGLKATLGKKTGKRILLRADMDALPIQEKTGLPYASQNDGVMHACGHDLHMAMLLGAAKILKKYEKTLNGEVVLMFQPGEEGYDGAKEMINAGLLEPPPDHAVALHIAATNIYPTGIIATMPGITFSAKEQFEIDLLGTGGHGAEPHNTINPINGALKIIEALKEMALDEIDSKIPVVLSIGKIHAGTAANIIPESCVIEGTLRVAGDLVSVNIVERIREIVTNIAKAYRLQSKLSLKSLPVLVNNREFTEKVHRWLSELEGVQVAPLGEYATMGSEDFSLVTQRIPSCYLFVLSKSPEGKHHPEHSPHVIFDNKALVYGAITYAQIAKRYLNG
jgi:amidohydrolase